MRPEWWERAVAAVIDGVLFAVPGFILQVVLIRLAFGDQTLMIAMAWLAILVSLAGYVVYKAWLESRPRQAAIGKMLLGLKVVTADGDRPSFRQSLVRTWPWWFLVLTGVEILLGLVAIAILIGTYLWTLVDGEGRGWHDRTAGCAVVTDTPTA